MAYTGAAFRQSWDKGGWNIAAYDIRFLYEDPLKPFKLGFKGAGRNVVISVNSEYIKSIIKEDAIPMIKSELDCGRPVIALGVVGPPEASIITGYRNNGETLLGWSLFQKDNHFNKNGEFDETGYFIKNDWWKDTQAIMSIGEEIGNRTPDIEVLKNALEIMSTENVSAYGDTDSFYGGQLAYKSWATALENHNLYTAENTGFYEACHADQVRMLEEGRYYAAEYMSLMANKYPHLSTLFNQCSKLLKSASDCTQPMKQLLTESTFSNSKTREQIATQVRQAAKCEKDACATLTEIINKF